MYKKYLEMNVYDALQCRLRFIFKEFDNIYVSFSGGKDTIHFDVLNCKNYQSTL